MNREPGQQAIINFLYHYLGVTGRPAPAGELRVLADGFNNGLRGRPLIELLHRDQRFLCREEQWGLACWQPKIVIDVETTGLSPRDNRITEIALVKLWGTHVADKWSSLVNPCRPIPPYIVRLVGISDEMVAEAPLFPDLLPKIEEFVGVSTLIAHNAAFDKSFLDAEFAWAGRAPLANPWLDTVAMARKLLPCLPDRKLVTVASYFGIDSAGHHRAVADALMAAGIYAKMVALEESLQVSS